MAISFDNISPKLDKILEQTYGQLIFQEQVTEIAQQLAGWTAGQADKLRKAIGRKIPEEMAELIPSLHKAFVEYGGITDEQASTLCTGIENCASYSFNKCLAGDELIGFADFEDVVSVRELYENKLLQLRKLNCMYVDERQYSPRYSMNTKYASKNNIKTVEKVSDCAPILKITLADNRTIKVTPQHKFPVVGIFHRSDVTAYEIFCKYKYEPMYLMVKCADDSDNVFENVRVWRCEFAGYSDVYNIEMADEPHNYIMANGIVTSNSHSVEYGLIAYETAYLKANAPQEYMCALLNANFDSEEDIVKYKAECERMGIEILPPSVKVGNLRYEPEGTAIRMGLNSIKGINDIKTTFYTNFDDYISKNGFNKRIKEALIKSGACDCFGLSRKEMLLRALNVYKDIQSYTSKILAAEDKIYNKRAELKEKKDGTKVKANLAKQIENLEAQIQRYEKERDVLSDLTYGVYNEVEGEKEVLGFTFQDEFKYYDTSKFPLYSERVSGVQTFWANIVSVKTIKDKNGNLMAFVGAIPYKHKAKVEFVVFASVYKKITTPICEGVALMKTKGNQMLDWLKQ